LKAIDLINTKNFLTGQLELYKIEFVNTNNNKYLSTMNDFDKAIKTINYLESALRRLVEENKQLKL
jgi:hypothetical protein